MTLPVLITDKKKKSILQNIHETSIKPPGRLLNVWSTFSFVLCPGVSVFYVNFECLFIRWECVQMEIPHSEHSLFASCIACISILATLILCDKLYFYSFHYLPHFFIKTVSSLWAWKTLDFLSLILFCWVSSLLDD